MSPSPLIESLLTVSNRIHCGVSRSTVRYYIVPWYRWYRIVHIISCGTATSYMQAKSNWVHMTASHLWSYKSAISNWWRPFLSAFPFPQMSCTYFIVFYYTTVYVAIIQLASGQEVSFDCPSTVDMSWSKHSPAVYLQQWEGNYPTSAYLQQFFNEPSSRLVILKRRQTFVTYTCILLKIRGRTWAYIS